MVKTNAGTEAVADHLLGNFIDTIAVGTGTTAETTQDTELVNEVFRASVDSSAVNFVKDDENPDEYLATIAITGGDEVAGDTTITELGLFISASGTMYSRDTYNGVTTDPGITSTLTTRITPPP